MDAPLLLVDFAPSGLAAQLTLRIVRTEAGGAKHLVAGRFTNTARSA